ncbi:MAG TPA: mechanosensitive ion channel domain-containing protein, partial [Solirubrobacterales bacterium]|nr:mechanosensitive ion channel domain-containing protein [Solirubrobacterales bacterium]
MTPAVSQVSRSTKTRLRFLRRLLLLIVFLVLLALALSQFTELKRLATGILASTAVLAAIVGFAAQHTIGNMVAGVQLAVSQPIKIGDRILFEEVDGRVTDITLSYTYVNPGDGTA